MSKLVFKTFKSEYFKPRDSWSELFIIHPFSVPLAYFILKITRSQKAPYVLTILTFVGSVTGAGLIYMGLYQIGAALLFAAFVLDNVDGTLSRFIYGKDPELRGTLDFTLDNFAWLPIVVSVFIVLLREGTVNEQFRFFLFVSLLTVLFTETTTALRLRQSNSKNSANSPNEEQDLGDSRGRQTIQGLLFRGCASTINFARTHGTFAYPTLPDVHVFVYILIPLFKFKQNIIFTNIGIVIITINIIIEGVGIFILLRNNGDI